MKYMTQTAKMLAKERGNICECCWVRRANEAHHCLYRRDKHVTSGVLEEKYNLQLVCYQCHYVTGKADSYANRVRFWQKQCERYGREVMLAWHSRVPYKIKEQAYQ